MNQTSPALRGVAGVPDAELERGGRHRRGPRRVGRPLGGPGRLRAGLWCRDLRQRDRGLAAHRVGQRGAGTSCAAADRRGVPGAGRLRRPPVRFLAGDSGSSTPRCGPARTPAWERNRFIQTWTGREGELRHRQREAAAAIRLAYETGDTDQAVLYTGQTAGLIDGLEPAATLVEQIIDEASALLRSRAPSLLAIH